MRAFTIVELIVVITIIALVLALAVPGISKMTADSRLSAATQTINATLTRAHVTALADRNMTAVRFVPGIWSVDAASGAPQAANRMLLQTYRYASTSSANPAKPAQILFDERFERIAGGDAVELPADTWAAPAEALSRQSRPGVSGANFGREFVLQGKPGTFKFDAGRSADFPNFDDYLVVFDPQVGVWSSPAPTLFALRGYDPGSSKQDTATNPANLTERFQRYAFTGVVLYPREPFLALGTDGGDSKVREARQDYLARVGRPYYVHRQSGGLVMGSSQ